MLRRVWNEIKSWYMRELVRDKGRLEDIVEYSSNVLKIIDGIEFEEFSSNILVYFATMKNVEIVGEAAYMLTRNSRQVTRRFLGNRWKVCAMFWCMVIRRCCLVFFGLQQKRIFPKSRLKWRNT